MNLQESIRRILREESKPILMIRRRVPDDDLEREFSESLEMSSNLLRNRNKKDGSIMSLNRYRCNNFNFNGWDSLRTI
jgi:hypothetical protein